MRRALSNSFACDLVDNGCQCSGAQFGLGDAIRAFNDFQTALDNIENPKVCDDAINHSFTG